MSDVATGSNPGILELRDVLFHLLRLAGPKGVTRTMLVKLVYFSELEHWRRYGGPLTGTPFRLHNYGAWAPEVVHVAEHEADAIEHSYFQGWFHPTHNYKLSEDVRLFDQLPFEVEDLLREVVDTYGRKTSEEVGKLSKLTEPMKDAVPGKRLDLSVAAPVRPKLRIRSDRLARARATLDLSQRGSRAELDKRDAEEIQAWAPARRQAAHAQD